MFFNRGKTIVLLFWHTLISTIVIFVFHFFVGGTVLFFVCITIYLYGDLAIYGAAVGKSLRDTLCTYFPADLPCNSTLNGTVACWEGVDLNRDNAYRLFLVKLQFIIKLTYTLDKVFILLT